MLVVFIHERERAFVHVRLSESELSYTCVDISSVCMLCAFYLNIISNSSLCVLDDHTVHCYCECVGIVLCVN